MRIFLAGDSTVTEQPIKEPFSPQRCYCGWGQMLKRFLRPDVEVVNLAVSGLTLETFRTTGQYEKLMSALSGGDYVFIQFGHNDQKRPHLRADGGYKQLLIDYVQEIRSKGGVAVLVTPVARNSWRGNDGSYNDLLEPYAATMKQTAAELDTALVDLHEVSMNWIKELGLQDAKRYFYPGDYTHPNHFGGFRWANFVAELILDNTHPSLTRLQAEVTTPEQCEVFNIAPDSCDPVFGWANKPAPRSNFGPWCVREFLTVAGILSLAQEAYGYFVSVDTEAEFPQSALACAEENGYLPPSLVGVSLDEGASMHQYAELMELACRGRNQLPTEAKTFINQYITLDTDVRCGDAIQFALKLEELSTGCTSEAADGYVPQGS